MHQPPAQDRAPREDDLRGESEWPLPPRVQQCEERRGHLHLILFFRQKTNLLAKRPRIRETAKGGRRRRAPVTGVLFPGTTSGQGLARTMQPGRLSVCGSISDTWAPACICMGPGSWWQCLRSSNSVFLQGCSHSCCVSLHTALTGPSGAVTCRSANIKREDKADRKDDTKKGDDGSGEKIKEPDDQKPGPSERSRATKSGSQPSHLGGFTFSLSLAGMPCSFAMIK